MQRHYSSFSIFHISNLLLYCSDATKKYPSWIKGFIDTFTCIVRANMSFYSLFFCVEKEAGMSTEKKTYDPKIKCPSLAKVQFQVILMRMHGDVEPRRTEKQGKEEQKRGKEKTK